MPCQWWCLRTVTVGYKSSIPRSAFYILPPCTSKIRDRCRPATVMPTTKSECIRTCSILFKCKMNTLWNYDCFHRFNSAIHFTILHILQDEAHALLCILQHHRMLSELLMILHCNRSCSGRVYKSNHKMYPACMRACTVQLFSQSMCCIPAATKYTKLVPFMWWYASHCCLDWYEPP